MTGQLCQLVGGLRGQRGELFSRSEAFVSSLDQQLLLLEHRHACDPGACPLGGLERLAPSPRPGHPLNGARVLLDKMVERCALADVHRGAMRGMVALERCCVGRAPIDGAPLRDPTMPTAGRGQELLGRLLLPLLREEQVEGLAVFVDCPRERVPSARHCAIRLVETPAHPPRPLPPGPRFLPPRAVLADPPVERGVSDVPPRSAMRASTWRVLRGSAPSQRTPMSILSGGTWAPVKRSAIVSPLMRCRWSWGKIILYMASHANCDKTLGRLLNPGESDKCRLIE